MGANPWQAPSDGATVEIWMANEEDARTEAWWRLGCNVGSQELWVVGMKEVWGASERSARSWYWPIRAPLPDYCVEQGSVSLIDENGEELQYLPESTDEDPHYFYVKMESPIYLENPSEPVTTPIEGKLLSYDYDGNVLDSLTVDLIYGNYSSYYHRSLKIEAVYSSEGDDPLVADAIALNTLRGGSVVSNAKGGGSKGVSTFATVIINSISFNWDTSGSVQDAMTVAEKQAGVPEWPIPAGQIYQGASQAAYLGGITPKIKASISVIPPDKTVRIHPVSAKCGNYSMMPTCFPILPKQTVTGTGDYEFEFGAALPQGITYMTDYLWWKIVLQSGVTIVTFPFVTGPHDMYAIDRPPVDSMADPYPWAEVLRYSTYLLSKDYYYGMTDHDILRILGRNLFWNQWTNDIFFGNSHKIQYDATDPYSYVTGRIGTDFDFHLSRFLGHLQNQPIQPDCYGVSSFYAVIANSLGVSGVDHLGLDNGSILGTKLTTKLILPIGYDPVVGWGQTVWDYHLTTAYPTSDGLIYEPAFQTAYGFAFGEYRDDYYNMAFDDPPADDISEEPRHMQISE